MRNSKISKIRKIRSKSKSKSKSKSNKFYRKKTKKKLNRRRKYSLKGGGILSTISKIATLPFKPFKLILNSALPAIGNALNSNNISASGASNNVGNNGSGTSNNLSNASNNVSNASNNVSNNVSNNASNNVSNNVNMEMDISLYNRILDNLESIKVNNANISTLKQLSQSNLVGNMPDYIEHLKVIDI